MLKVWGVINTDAIKESDGEGILLSFIRLYTLKDMWEEISCHTYVWDWFASAIFKQALKHFTEMSVPSQMLLKNYSWVFLSFMLPDRCTCILLVMLHHLVVICPITSLMQREEWVDAMWNFTSLSGKEPELVCEIQSYGLHIVQMSWSWVKWELCIRLAGTYFKFLIFFFLYLYIYNVVNYNLQIFKKVPCCQNFTQLENKAVNVKHVIMLYEASIWINYTVFCWS